MSAFAIIKKGNAVLAGKPASHERWQAEWASNWRGYDKQKMDREMVSWRLPSSYIFEGESTDETLRRIMNNQLGINEYKIDSSRLVNYYEPSTRDPRVRHWDYCFVYYVETNQEPTAKNLPWFSYLGFVTSNDLRKEDFGSGIGDLAESLGLINKNSQ